MIFTNWLKILANQEYLCANANPDHDTINSFRKRFNKEIAGLFVELLVQAEAMGMLKLGTVSLDGTKIVAEFDKFCDKTDFFTLLAVELLYEIPRQVSRHCF